MVFIESKQKSRILLLLFSAMIVVSISVSLYRFFILRDYTIQSQVPCDPYEESCFVYVCDPSAEECTGDPVVDTSYYKLLNRNAGNVPTCDPNEAGCNPLFCPDNEEECTITTCTTSLAEENGTECTYPNEYSQQFPRQGEVLMDDPLTPLE